jgi:GT2 family glycosyltransferase
MSKIAYIVVGWNNLTLLGECFSSIEKQESVGGKIIYVDNASKDNSVDFVRSNFPDALVIPQSKNTGFAKGNNIGIKEALNDPQIEYIALINSDARIAPDWSEKIIKLAAHKPKGACYQGTNLDYYKHSVIDSTHIYVSHNGQGTQGNWRYYDIAELGPKKIFGVNAAACVISRKFIKAQPFGSKVFDESFFMYLEDIDLAARSTIMGWDNYLVPGARAYHMGSASSGKNPRFSLYMTFRNNCPVLFKNFSMRENIKIAPKLIRGDLDTILTLHRRKQNKAIWSVIKGRCTGLLRLPLYIWKRHQVFRKRKIDADYLWLLMRRGY